MKRICFSVWTVILLCVIFIAPAAKQSRAADDSGDFYPPKMSFGPHNVSVINLDWYDASRERQVPIRMYLPADGQDPFPLIIFSHGLGGSREDYEYVGRHWASHGLVSVHVQHLGSDKAVWRQSFNPLRALKRAINPVNSYNRTLDVSFALDRLRELNQNDDLLQGRFDLDRVGVAGHSYGAFTSMLLAGQRSFGSRRSATLTGRFPNQGCRGYESAGATIQGHVGADLCRYQDAYNAFDRYERSNHSASHEGYGAAVGF